MSLKNAFKSYRKEGVLAPLFKFLEACFELVMPLIMAHMVDDIIPQSRLDLIWQPIGLFVILALSGAFMAIIAQFYAAKAAVGISSLLSRELFSKILALPQVERDQLNGSSLVNRLTSDVLQLQTGINLFLRLFLRAPIIILGSVTMAFIISPDLTLFFIVMLLLLTIIVWGLSLWLKPFYQDIRYLLDKLVVKTREQMRGMRVIRAFNHSQQELDGFGKLNRELLSKQIITGRLADLISPLTFVVVNITLVCLLWRGHILVKTQILSQGAIVALVNYLTQLLGELLKLVLLLQSLNEANISRQRIQEVLDLPSEESTALLKVARDEQYSIVIKDLSFTYPTGSSPALSTIQLQLRKGEHLGIIGGTGAGKSTLIHLLSGNYIVDKGRLSLYHDNNSPQTLEEWRQWTGLVPQTADLFQGTIRDNLLLGSTKNHTEESLWHALDIAQASEFVSHRDGQLESNVLAFGHSLSGGQRQRLTIARAILKHSPFLLLDDAFSALDPLTEQRLLEALTTELANTTLVIVSQKTKVLQRLDKILVLDKGQQVGFGSHNELLASNAIYQEIYASQERLESGELNG
ncbi:ABC transporter ATP-binding protein [Streptococcus fryi]